MALADELQKLDELRQRGTLTEEEFARAKARLLEGQPAAGPVPPGVQAINSFRRSSTDKWIGGVCGGLARLTGVESWIWRLLFAVLACFGGAGVLLYLLLWIFVPQD
jgi:phage shock protein PspC (stress-responsive transcriptional regulator)